MTALHREAGAATLGLSLDAFADRLESIAVANLPSRANSAQIAEFCRKLHLRDLALAQACALGIELAWESFLKRYGPKLYWSACKITKDEFRARELADSVCTDLFYTAKLASYSGRGSLENWLKATLFQAHIDHYRSERRYQSFDDDINAIRCDAALGFPLGRHDSDVVEETLKESIRETEPEERVMLVAYFLDGRSLAQIASMLSVHESTISRRLARSLKTIRKRVGCKLRMRGIDQHVIAELINAGLSEVSFDLRSELLVGSTIGGEQ